jgi:hypothetical protein
MGFATTGFAATGRAACSVAPAAVHMQLSATTTGAIKKRNVRPLVYCKRRCSIRATPWSFDGARAPRRALAFTFAFCAKLKIRVGKNVALHSIP